jgi:hypothetical protein
VDVTHLLAGREADDLQGVLGLTFERAVWRPASSEPAPGDTVCARLAIDDE